MPARSPERPLAAASLALVLVVVFASAAIRLSGQDLGSWLPLVRGTHRASASLATLLILGLAWFAWRAGRRPPVVLLVALTAGLSVLGAATGIAPPPWAQAGNLLGGLALAVLLAWLLGLKEGRVLRVSPYAGLFAVQLLLGAWIAIFAEELWTPVLFAHVLLGLALAGGAAWLFLRKARLLFSLLAIIVPASGAASALLGLPLGATLAHAASVALLACAAAYAHARAA
jgi:hypothetical protein